MLVGTSNRFWSREGPKNGKPRNVDAFQGESALGRMDSVRAIVDSTGSYTRLPGPTPFRVNTALYP
jgi:hypothetical protein